MSINSKDINETVINLEYYASQINSLDTTREKLFTLKKYDNFSNFDNFALNSGALIVFKEIINGQPFADVANYSTLEKMINKMIDSPDFLFIYWNEHDEKIPKHFELFYSSSMNCLLNELDTLIEQVNHFR